MITKKSTVTRRLCESAIMIALATILSLLKLVDLPYGGSITLASMLPILIIAYRHGTAWGILTSTVHGAMQFILGTSVLSYVTGWMSVCAVIVFDYVLAFSLIGLGGIFKNMKSQRGGLVLGALTASAARYLCHFISGVTVWRDISIPGGAAVVYSLSYNATYMIPETIVLCAAAYYIASCLNFKSLALTPIKRGEKDRSPVLTYLKGATLIATLVFDVAIVFSKLQNADTGSFDITGLAKVNFPLLLIVSASGTALFTIFSLIPKFARKMS